MEGRDLFAGRYELRGVLGRGGMAEVQDGWDTRLDRAVAIKLLHPAFAADVHMRRRFEDEARAAAGLNHPNIVAVHDSGEQNWTPFIVMERLPGRTLADLIASGPMPPQRVRAMLCDVLGALATAHAAGILHRDVKPANILVTADGNAMKVADFGIAKTAGAAHTATGQIVGTMAYMSPERVAGVPASVADDLYAVGVMGYEGLTGRRPYPQENPATLLRAILDQPPPPIAVVRPDIDPVLAAVIDHAMARDAGKRFDNAEQMRAALAGAPSLSAMPASPPAPRPATKVLAEPLAPSAAYFVPPKPRRKRMSRERKLLLAAALFVAFVVAGLALALDPSSTTRPPQPISTSTTTQPPPPPTTTPPPPPSNVAPVIEAPKKPKKGNPGNGNGRGNGNKKGND
ncbi:serine/threonine-protein kinase [Mycolicibacterium sp. ND9-15]|uniref:serine/threonine-protein kinase n=1 Tax=Mycolicibacterium sp. ND9-15 TaxID=3042320 RepID=UPI002DD9BFC7|nr:serine/threonine-protein kinase [Mycolicibacterium sp. ND9-15]WSE58213.1 serine/threonine-protein kinase [Mycolicibacterium sp. ND9-15]